MAWQGPDRMRGHNLLRRLLLAHYVPRLDGQIVPIPISGQYPILNGITEKMDLESIAKCSGRGVEVYSRMPGGTKDPGPAPAVGPMTGGCCPTGSSRSPMRHTAAA